MLDIFINLDVIAFSFQPKSADINFQSFFGDMSRDMSHVEESVSDSELQSSKRSEPIMNGYYSDGEDNQVSILTKPYTIDYEFIACWLSRARYRFGEMADRNS